MSNKTIKIRDGEEYITLGTLLKVTGIIDTGGQAKYFLAENEVLVNDEPENRRGRKLYHGAIVRVGIETILID